MAATKSAYNFHLKKFSFPNGLNLPKSPDFQSNSSISQINISARNKIESIIMTEKYSLGLKQNNAVTFEEYNMPKSPSISHSPRTFFDTHRFSLGEIPFSPKKLNSPKKALSPKEKSLKALPESETTKKKTFSSDMTLNQLKNSIRFKELNIDNLYFQNQELGSQIKNLKKQYLNEKKDEFGKELSRLNEIIETYNEIFSKISTSQKDNGNNINNHSENLANKKIVRKLSSATSTKVNSFDTSRRSSNPKNSNLPFAKQLSQRIESRLYSPQPEMFNSVSSKIEDQGNLSSFKKTLLSETQRNDDRIHRIESIYSTNSKKKLNKHIPNKMSLTDIESSANDVTKHRVEDASSLGQNEEAKYSQFKKKEDLGLIIEKLSKILTKYEKEQMKIINQNLNLKAKIEELSNSKKISN